MLNIPATAPPGGVLLATAIAVPAAVGLGAVYGYVSCILPFVHLATLVAAPVLGVMFAAAAVHGFKLGRVRHVTVGVTVVMIATAVGFYMAWVAWVAAIVGLADGVPWPGTRWTCSM
jgi:hypothetical protein